MQQQESVKSAEQQLEDFNEARRKIGLPLMPVPDKRTPDRFTKDTSDIQKKLGKDGEVSAKLEKVKFMCKGRSKEEVVRSPDSIASLMTVLKDALQDINHAVEGHTIDYSIKASSTDVAFLQESLEAAATHSAEIGATVSELISVFQMLQK